MKLRDEVKLHERIVDELKSKSNRSEIVSESKIDS
jgi:hypothetical protein